MNYFLVLAVTLPCVVGFVLRMMIRIDDRRTSRAYAENLRRELARRVAMTPEDKRAEASAACLLVAGLVPQTARAGPWVPRRETVEAMRDLEAKERGMLHRTLP